MSDARSSLDNAKKSRREEIPEDRLFLETMARLADVPDKDSTPRSARIESPRRVSVRTRRTGATIDLHGETRAQAREILERQVTDARRRGCRSVLVITGKGKRSPGGAGVLAAMLESWLRADGGALGVDSFGVAPKRLGGNGAYVLFLR